MRCNSCGLLLAACACNRCGDCGLLMAACMCSSGGGLLDTLLEIEIIDDIFGGGDGNW